MDSAIHADGRKLFVTLAARLALVGLQLHRLDDGTLLVTCSRVTHRFADEAATARFIEDLEVRS